MKTMTDDELLSAYIDGELEAEAADRLTERLAEEPALMQRLEAMRRADASVKEAFHEIDRRPMPKGVLDLLGKPAPKSNVIAFPAMRRFFEPPAAIAAGVALAVGILVAGIFGGGTPDADGVLTAGAVTDDSALYRVLESGTSGEAIRLGGSAAATVILSFEDTTGDYCRQLRVDADESSTHGLACRRDGSWQLEAIALGTAGPGGTYGQASGEVPAALRIAVDERLGDGDVLEAEEENRLISEAWKKAEE